MKRTVLLLTLLATGMNVGYAAVSVRICGPNEVVPFDFSNIMVGQELTLIVSSDPNDYWSGAFFVEGDDRALGTLYGRDSDPNLRDFTDSHYPAAGDFADVFAWRDSDIWGFDMYSSDVNCVSGDWFIIDYKAQQPGTCRVNFYDYNTSWTEPNTVFAFNQDPSCDFDGDGYINMSDFNKLSYYWLADCFNCADVNDCLSVDLDYDSVIGVNDLMIFARHWFWDGSLRVPEEVFVPTPDPNLIYSIADANGFDEIYLNTGESIRLYVDLYTYGQSDLMSFDIEVQISDPNMGTIINTTDPNFADPNDMPYILAIPRYDAFDITGPANTQQEGVRFSAYNFTLDPNNPSINDGHLASFVYTAGVPGDVTLNIVNNSSTNMLNETVYPTVESILIHQSDQQLLESQSIMTSEPVTMASSTQQTMDIDETISFLEQIYQEDQSLQTSIDPVEWQDFLDAVRESYNNSL